MDWTNSIIELYDGEDAFLNCISISNFYTISESNIEFNNSKEIYFLGENGDGKTLYLLGIYLAFRGNFVQNKTAFEQTGKAIDIIQQNRNSKLIGRDSKGKKYSLGNGTYSKNLYAYGTYRGRYSTENSEKYGFMTLFDNDRTLISPISWLKDQKLKDDHSSAVSISRLQDMYYEILERNVKIEFEGSQIYFIEKGAKLTLEQLSEGYRSIIVFITDLVCRLSESFPHATSVADFSGVVLVDEIDLHLHPKWQRSLLGKLRALFPKIQFIMTTHSPSIVQGASDDAVFFRVYRTKDGKTCLSDAFYRKNLDHLMMNSVLTSPLFGLEDARMNESEKYADTSDSYLHYRIHKKIEEELAKQKEEGKLFFGVNEIDVLIQKIMNEELDKDDKNQ